MLHVRFYRGLLWIHANFDGIVDAARHGTRSNLVKYDINTSITASRALGRVSNVELRDTSFVVEAKLWQCQAVHRTPGPTFLSVRGSL